MFKQLKLVILSTYLLCLPLSSLATLVQPKLFDLRLIPEHDNAEYWAVPKGTDRNEPLMSEQAQQKQFQRMQENWFAPWSQTTVSKQIEKEAYPRVLASIVRGYRNEIAHGQSCTQNPNPQYPVIQSNYRPFSCEWLDNIVANANYPQFDALTYNARNRAIITHNAFVRVFPTHDTYYRRYKNSGRINPFDRMQMSVAWAGTPVYILGTTKDNAWHYVYTQSYSGWVQAKDAARVDDGFVEKWQHSDDDLIAIVKNNVSLNNAETDNYITQVGIGAVFPGRQTENQVKIKVPVTDQYGIAHIATVKLQNDERPTALAMPVAPTRANFAHVMQGMVNKPYAWGGQCYLNDCSLELKNIYTPFGVWLARNSKAQVDGLRKENLDSMQNYKQRLDYLRKHGKPFMTLVYIGSHIMLYVGEDEHNMPTLYQNMWAVHGKDRGSEKYMVGQSLFLPAEVKNTNVYSMIHPNITSHFWLAHIDEPQ